MEAWWRPRCRLTSSGGAATSAGGWGVGGYGGNGGGLMAIQGAVAAGKLRKRRRAAGRGGYGGGGVMRGAVPTTMPNERGAAGKMRSVGANGSAGGGTGRGDQFPTRAVATESMSPEANIPSSAVRTSSKVVDFYADVGLAEYRSSLGTMGQDTNAHYTGEAYSVWDGSYAFGKHKEKAVFVDENACIGCMNCVHCSSKSFAIEPVHGRARVVAQWADDRDKLNMAFDSCPVSCIHWVDKSDLPLLEYAMRTMDRTHVAGQLHGASASKNCTDPFEMAKDVKRKVNKIVWTGPSCKWPRGS